MFIPLEGDARVIAGYLLERINELNVIERGLCSEWHRVLTSQMAKYKLNQAKFDGERLGFEVPDADSN